MAQEQQKEQQLIDQIPQNYFDFMSKYKKEEEYFKAPRTANGKPWPRIKPILQMVYENWLAQVVDPVTGEYHKGPNGETARYAVDRLVRIRLLDGQEKLYSYGQLIGYNSFKDKKTYACDQPEVHLKINFGYETRLGNNNQIRRVTTGPESAVEVFDLDFTPENADKLWALKKDRAIKLVVKDALSNEPRSVEVVGGRLEQSNLDSAFELFKNSSFEYLYNAEYLKKGSTSTTTDDLKDLKQAKPDSTPNTKTKFEAEKVK